MREKQTWRDWLRKIETSPTFRELRKDAKVIQWPPHLQAKGASARKLVHSAAQALSLRVRPGPALLLVIQEHACASEQPNIREAVPQKK